MRGSEVSRASSWSARHPQRAEAALHRALELIDLTLDDPRHRASVPRLREIARLREVIVDFFAGPNQYGSTAASLQKYLDAYAVALVHSARVAPAYERRALHPRSGGSSGPDRSQASRARLAASTDG